MEIGTIYGLKTNLPKNTTNSGWSWDHGEGMGVFAADKFKRKTLSEQLRSLTINFSTT